MFFDRIRDLLTLYRAGHLLTLEGAKLLHALIGDVLDAMTPDGFMEVRAGQALALSSEPYDPHADLIELEGLLPEHQKDLAITMPVNWSRWLPVLVRILEEILRGK